MVLFEPVDTLLVVLLRIHFYSIEWRLSLDMSAQERVWKPGPHFFESGTKWKFGPSKKWIKSAFNDTSVK